MNIDIDLNVKSINQAMTKLYKFGAKERLEKAAKRIAEIGGETIEAIYKDKVHVEVNQTEDGYVIMAVGKKIMFLEFGTGIYTDTEYGNDVGLSSVVLPGMWSQTEGKGQFIPGVHEWWIFGSTKIEGTRPMRGFQFATEEMLQRAVEIVREEFK